MRFLQHSQKESLQQSAQRESIIKPTASIILLSLPLFWIGLIVAEKLCWFKLTSTHISAAFPLLIALALLSTSIPLVLGSNRSRLIFGGLLVSSLVAGVLVGSLYWLSVREGETALARHCLTGIELKVTSDPREGMYAQASEAMIRTERFAGIRIRVFWPADEEALPLGTVLMTSGNLIPLDKDDEWLFEKGISASMKLKGITSQQFDTGPIGSIERLRLRNMKLIDRFDGSGSALLRGVVLGDTTALQGSEQERDFKITGLSHLIAVSGGHLMIIAALTCWFTARLRINHFIEFLLLMLLLVAYVLLTGFQASAIRACFMTLVASYAWFMGRRRHAPSALGFAALLMLALNPANALSLGFSLSVCAVLGLCLLVPLIKGWIAALLGCSERRNDRLTRFKLTIIEPFALTVTAQAATLPLTVPTFAMLSLIAPLANLLVTPFISIMIAGGIVAVGVSILSADVAMMPLSLLCRVGDITASLVHWLASLPFAAIPMTINVIPAFVLTILLFAVIRMFWPQPRTAIARAVLGLMMIVLLMASQVSTHFRSPALVMMDVGQGDALLVRGGKRTILIDTGEYESELLKALARQGIRHLDAVVITHLDNDHCGALAVLRGTVSVDHIYFAEGIINIPGSSNTNKASELASTAAGLCTQKEAESIGFGESIALDTGLSLTMVWPRQPIENGTNEESICMLLAYDIDADGKSDITALLTGDAEAEALDQLLNGNIISQAMILKVGHHGSEGAVTSQQLRQLDTRIALISVGENNRFGHPSSKVIQTLENQGIQTYRTDLNGDVSITMNKDGFRVHCDTIIDRYG